MTGSNDRYDRQQEQEPEHVKEIAGTIYYGGVYRYLSGLPSGCRGFHYRVLDEVVSVPTYNKQILIRALNGPDKGLLFCCSPSNFLSRYELVRLPESEQPVEEQPAAPPLEEKAAGFISKSASF